jgi:hypothetical protein
VAAAGSIAMERCIYSSVIACGILIVENLLTKLKTA